MAIKLETKNILIPFSSAYLGDKLIYSSGSMLMEREDIAYVIGAYRAGLTTYTPDKIKTITILNSNAVPDDGTVVASWDVSYNENGSVMAWIINSTTADMYDLYIGGKGEIIAPTNSTNLFRNYTKSTKITGLNLLNTSKVTSMFTMFYYCNSLTALDIGGWDTSNVTNMHAMFGGCNSLTTLNLNGWNTSNVTNMRQIFSHCSSLKTLGISSWNTGNVADMSAMFYSCSSLKTLGISSWNTGNVADMSAMFQGCSSLSTLDPSNWNTGNVTDMGNMFYSCSSLSTLNISSWNTGNVESMSFMFYDCRGLATLDMSNWNTEKVTGMYAMFYSCNSLSTLDISNWNTSNVTNMGYMFYSCNSLSTLDPSNWNTGNVTDMGNMFYGCSSLTSLDISNWNTSNVTNMGYMFRGCSGLSTLNLNSWDTGKVTNMGYMFQGYSSLTTLTLGENFDKLNGNNMFYLCQALAVIITRRKITSSSQAMTLTTNTQLNTTAILYVPDATSETYYESATNYSTVFGADRIKQMLELVGEATMTAVKNKIFTDPGVLVAGYATATEYEALGYSVTTTGSVDTSIEGTYTITYTLKGSNNYDLDSKTREVVVKKGDITPVVSMSSYSRTGGTLPEPSISGNDGNGEVTYYYNTRNSTTGGLPWSNVTNSRYLGAGQYYMYAVVEETENYNGATSSTDGFRVT